MAQYRNETKSAQVIGGQVIAPRQSAELADDTAGLQRMVKRGVVSKQGGESKPAAQKSSRSGESKQEDKE